MKKSILAVFGLIATFGVSAQEWGKGYFGLGYSFLNADMQVTTTTDSDEFDVADNDLVGLILGFEATPNLAAELRAYKNARSSDYAGSRLAIERNISMYGRFIIPMHQYAKLYALVGYGTNEFQALGATFSDEALAYGIGGAFSKGGPITLNVEWVSLYDDTTSASSARYDIEMTTVNLNLIYQF